MTTFGKWNPKYMLVNRFEITKVYLAACPPRCSSVANAGGRAFCHELDIGWVHIVQLIFLILAISAGLFWKKGVFFCFYIIKSIARKGYFGPKYP